VKTFLVGGARSGKSRVALQLAEATNTAVAMVVTAEPIDDEMAERIQRHRAERPVEWATIEAPYDLAAGIDAAPTDHTLVVDCLTLWLSNLIVRGDDDPSIEAATSAAIEALLGRESNAVVVSNEVGMGLVPADPMSRRFRDAQGRLNQTLAARCDRAYVVIAGRALALVNAQDLADD